jgi:hypothetical protein
MNCFPGKVPLSTAGFENASEEVLHGATRTVQMAGRHPDGEGPEEGI